MPPSHRGLAVLASNAGGDEDFDTFVKSYRVAYEMELDELEELMLIRNALAQKSRDEMKDANKP